MSAKSLTGSDEGVQSTNNWIVEATIRVPSKASGSLLDIVCTKLTAVDSVESAVVNTRKDVTPKNGAIYVTVESSLTVADSVSTDSELRTAISNQVGIESISTM